MFFEDSRPDRKKRAQRQARLSGTFQPVSLLTAAPLPDPKKVDLVYFGELFNSPDRTFVGDVECYPNYFEAGFKDVHANVYIFFEIVNEGYLINGVEVKQKDWISCLSFVLHRFLTIGFNYIAYDLPMMQLAMKGLPTWKLKEHSDEIIQGGMRIRDTRAAFGLKELTINAIDVMEVAPLHDSLKTYAGRLHAPRMQELPYGISEILSPQQIAYVRGYNVNDLDNTQLLYEELASQIELREELANDYPGIDFRSKSDAQVAETIIGSELEKIGIKGERPKIEPGLAFRYQVPHNLHFNNPVLQAALETVRNTDFIIGDNGSADTPKAISSLKIRLGNSVYRMGNGGLHSSEESVSHKSTEDLLLIDKDVASYYPRIIITQRLFPKHLGEAFLRVYEDIVNRRLDCKKKAGAAKKAGDKKLAKFWSDKSDALKIAINGIFGKLGNKYSRVYSPQLVTQVTVSGQLFLLKLIEMIEHVGISVISANTDGIVIRCPKDRYDDLEAVVKQWEMITDFVTEETRYAGLHCRDVNNYIAVKYAQDKDGSWLDTIEGCKTKGVYSEKGSALNSILSKNPESYICSLAVQEFLAKGTPLTETIDNCMDIKKFVNVRKVEGGAVKEGTFLGKVIRWYYAEGETGAIHRKTNGDKVPKSEGAKPLMDLPEVFPNDVCRDHYVREATEILYDLGYYSRPKTANLFA